jgi:hypothetical protein
MNTDPSIHPEFICYRTRVEITDTGMVVASVFAPDGRRVGLDFFSPIVATTKAIQRNAKKAHEWAKNHAAMCARMETDNVKKT